MKKYSYPKDLEEVMQHPLNQYIMEKFPGKYWDTVPILQVIKERIEELDDWDKENRSKAQTIEHINTMEAIWTYKMILEMFTEEDEERDLFPLTLESMKVCKSMDELRDHLLNYLIEQMEQLEWYDPPREWWMNLLR
ncbi:hypothetical protein SAMN02745751_03173 [Dethiosulfatibacter aminovorans DSM 17477]|uniref:Uncharacterized protein n=1 Tax=Dethiosulfatibacter aminovorans DSM 17477 TaxID=1121476 RepID=A0A1M6LH54_9FIRM|nr:hypothetical protein [Dethiosulfatibacter aminovorans]SHJ70532.1 hypothetical protein SAMN02745751_03173 [Dethiosulfatibacter aminovorans DSM 17477]